MEISTRRVLIPAAGFGKRVGSPAAKELLPDPETGRPMIEFALERAREAHALPVVITRRDKHALIEWTQSRPEIELLLIDGSKEWPDTLLQSEPLWGETNVVVLPDTRFAPLDSPLQLFIALESGTAVSYGVFDAADLSTWGVISVQPSRIELCEKPRGESANRTTRPWGMFGWQRNFGRPLLEAKLASTADHVWRSVSTPAAVIELDSFIDLTRGESDRKNRSTGLLRPSLR